ncbi:MAG: D-2-hydroxyacid dehydrogenase [Verrucomicrobia bacterium]|nr:D-2-hydroxyacid dehydrogenase [Verrucomicrobiota bacterium]
MAQLTIWTNAFLDDAARQQLRQAAGEHRLIIASSTDNVLAEGAPDPTMHEADVAFGQPDPETLVTCPRLRWVQVSSAGFTRYDTPAIRALVAAGKLQVTNSSWVYAEPCAQHALAFILASARQLHAAYDAQRANHAWEHLEIRARSRLLNRKTILLAGFGSIGARLAELLAPFGATVYGLRRRRQSLANVELITIDELPATLAGADHVVNLLPDDPSTRLFFNAARFEQFKSGADYCAIGRGTTTDQDALLGALRSGRLSAAYLDVTEPEPLPPDHPLWSAPNCYITPHSSGGHADESERLVEHFVRNLHRFERQQPLDNRILQPGG